MKQKRYSTYRILYLIKAACAICCFMPFQLFSQSASGIKNFTTANGLPQNMIAGMVFDSTGYLWLSTAYGVIRYDGFGFNTYLPDTLNSKANVSNQVLDMFITGPQKKIFIRTKNGLLHTIRDGRLELYDSTIKNTTFIYGLRGHFPNPEIFMKFNLTYDELVHKHDWDANAREILPVNTTDFIVLSNNKRILFYYRNGSKQSSISLSSEFNFFLKAGKYNLLGDFNHNLYLYDSATNSFININHPLSNSIGKNWNEEKPAWYWDTYNDESYCYYNSVFYRIEVEPAAKALKFIPLFSVEKDRHSWTGIIHDPVNEIYYLSTLTDGLFQVRLKQIQTFNVDNELSIHHDAMEVINYSVLKTGDSTVFTTAGLEFTNGIHGAAITRKTPVYSNRETMGLSGDSGIICAEGKQVFYYLRSENFGKKHIYNDAFNKQNTAYITLLQPEGDSLWIGSYHSIDCITRNRVNTLFKRNPDGKGIFFGIRLFYRLSKEDALISNDFGLYKLRTSPPYTIDSFPEMKEKQVRHISPYKDALILSVYKHGLYVFRNNLFYKVPVSDDQPELNFCHSTYIDKKGDIWVTTDKGLFRSSISGIMESVSNPGIYPFFYNYGEADGIENAEFNGGGTPSYAVLDNGQIFYPSMGGIVTFNPGNLSNTLSGGSIPVEKIESDNKNLPVSDSIYLNAGFRYLGIQLSVPHFGGPENLLLEYNLDSTGWKKIQVSPSQRILLYNLSSGNHQLLIRRRVGLGNSDYVYKTLTLFREKHIYEQAWFYPAIAIAFSLLAFLIVEMQTRNVAKKRIALRKLVEEQTYELSKTVEVKELLINVISHDMVTPLRHISLVAGFLEKGLEKNPKRLTSALLDIESTSHKILTGSLAIIDYMKYNSSKVIVNRKNVNIYDLVQEVCEIFVPVAREKNIGLKNNVTRSGFAEIDDTIFSIILNNIISNAVKYSGKGVIEIFLEPGPETETVLKIKDAGPGMDKDTLHIIHELLNGNLQAVKTTNKASTGLGYMLISELVKVHNLALSVESGINKGTTVSIVMP